jgi:hypothetical protein
MNVDVSEDIIPAFPWKNLGKSQKSFPKKCYLQQILKHVSPQYEARMLSLHLEFGERPRADRLRASRFISKTLALLIPHSVVNSLQ